MAILNLRKYPDPCLLKVSQPVDKVSLDEIGLLQDMAETMYANDGLGLAAPQVGVNKRLIVVDVGEGLLKLINPEIIERSGEDTYLEGCLSVPKTHVKIARAKKIKIRAQDQNGQVFEKELQDFTAKAVQQEIDHLNGKLILEYLPWHKRALIKLWIRLTCTRREKC